MTALSTGPLGAQAKGPARDAGRPRLFCFPYAGGSAAVFRRWPRALSEVAEVRPVELPGRTAPAGRPPIREIGELTRCLLGELAPELNGSFVFFGHSLGALVAFELTRLLRSRGLPQPDQLFVAALAAPQLGRRFDPPLSGLPDARLLERLFAAGGVPKAVLQSQRLIKSMLPRLLAVLRADLEILETYTYAVEAPLDCPITAIGGSRDPFVRPDDVLAWDEQTTAAFHAEFVEGDHFFIDKRPGELLSCLDRLSHRRPFENLKEP